MTPQDLGLTSWAPLVVTLVIGFILGWLITGLPPRRKLSRMESQAQDLDAKLNQTNKTLAASQAHEQELQSGLDAANANLAEATAKVTALQKEIAAAHQHEQELQAGLDAARADRDQVIAQADALQQTLDAREGELTDLKLQHSTLRSTAQQSYGTLTSQVESLQAEITRLTDENETLKINLEGTAGDLAKARAEVETVTQSLANKDTALTEAYARAVRLERESSEEQRQLLALQAEVATLRRNIGTLTASNQDMNSRLQNARGEVANELAVLTSTMLRVKDEQLAQANSTIAALQAQMAATAGRSALS